MSIPDFDFSNFVMKLKVESHWPCDFIFGKKREKINKKNWQISANFVKVQTFSFIFVYNSRTTLCDFCTSSLVILICGFNLCDLFKILFFFVWFRLHFVLTIIYLQATLHLHAIAQKCAHCLKGHARPRKVTHGLAELPSNFRG